MIVSLFDKSGRFVQELDGDAALVIEPTVQATGLRYAEGSHGDKQYLVAGTVYERPGNPAVLNGNLISGLPFGATIIINNAVYHCDDDHAELEFDQPGIYAIRVIAWPYLDKEFVFENPA